MRSRWHVGRHLDRGEPVRVLPDVPTRTADIYALTEDDAHSSQRVSRLNDFLAARLPRRLNQRHEDYGLL
ncbi:hypothetical protein GCM10018780_82540 [Streptomyces lanatus]|nr:hypothetical protein GCM10018780_82540 [Streptomyces lanatus]